MSYTGTEIFNQSIAVIDELSDTGQVSDSQVREYKSRAPFLLDMWQHEIMKNSDTSKTFEISCFRKINLLGDLACYGIIKENKGGETFYYTSPTAAYCAYIEVDNDSTVTITCGGNPVTGKYIFNGGTETDFTGTINITVPDGTTSFLPLKAILSDVNGPVTFTITSQYYSRHTNVALGPYKYASTSKVPDYKPWYKVEMPADFKSRTQVINEYPNWQYEEDNYRKWENGRELYVNFAYEGIIRINYKPTPVKITSLTQTLEVDEETAISGAYYLAEHFAIADQNDELAMKCRDKYKELKIDSMIKQPLSPTEIKDVYGG